MAQGDVERLGSDELGRQVRGRAFETRVENGHDRLLSGRACGKSAQGIGQPRDLLRHDLQPERLDGDQSITLRIIGSKNGAENATAYLMQDAIRAEGGRRGETGGLVERQRRLLEVRTSKL
jgi:hypothetical protein